MTTKELSEILFQFAKQEQSALICFAITNDESLLAVEGKGEILKDLMINAMLRSPEIIPIIVMALDSATDQLDAMQNVAKKISTLPNQN